MIKITTPKTQKEKFLCAIVEGVDNAPSAVTREEKFFAEILKRPAQAPSPVTRYEKHLAKIAGHDVDIPTPCTRLEYFLAKAARMDIQTPIPITREEMYWSNYAPAPTPTTKTIEGILPLVFSADGNNLTDYTIYGASGGVGDYNSTTGKYDIPVTISGKNIIVNTLASQTYNGITLTRNSDGSVTLNGTAEASMNFSMTRDTHTLYSDDYQPIENAVYVISGSPQGAAVNKYMMSFRYVSAIGLTSSFTRVPPDGRTIDNTGGEFNYIAPYISVWSGITCNNVTFYPMLRKIGMGDEYEPPSTSTTVTLSVDAPLTSGQTLSLADTQIDLSTVNGTNEIVVGATTKPSKVKLSGEVEFIREGEPTVYTISYYSQDGTTLLGTEYVEPEHNGHGLLTNPTKESTAQYNFTFAGWSDTTGATTATSNVLDNVTANRSVYAAFSETLRTYTVYFYGDNNVLLQTVQNVPYGGSATYTESTPTKSGYNFTGWSPAPTNISGDTSCYAQFEQIPDYITDSWETIDNRGKAGTAQNYYSVGDCKPIELNGTMGTLALDTTLYVYILGFNHNSTYEPNGITFGGFKTAATNGADVCLVDSNYNSYSTDGSKWFNMSHKGNYNYGGWKGCDMRYDILGSTDVQPSGYGSTPTTSKTGYDATSTCATNPVANTLMSCLPSDLRAVMKPMTKYTDNTGNGSNVEANVTASIDYLPLLSEYEVRGTRNYANQYEQNKQARYAYYIAGNSKVKYQHSATSSAADWWCRSAGYSSSDYFCYVRDNGYANNYFASDSRGVSPIFLVGSATNYTVSYYSQDGQTLIHTETVTEGHDATYSTTPTKQSTTQYDYTFAGWNTSPNQTTATANITQNIQSDLNLYAAFSETVRTYTVYFYNESTLLETVTGVPYGGTATYTGATPTSSQAGYIFSGWSPSNTNITADTSCYAQFVDDDMYESISDTWPEIIANVSNGTYSTKYQVGDTKKIDLGTEGEVIMTIVGIDTDDLADDSGKAPITWISKQLLQTSHRMNPTHSSGTEGTGSLGGWEKTEMRSYLKETVKPLIPETVRNAIKPVKKYTNIYNVSGLSVSNVLTTEDVWIPSRQEVFGNYSSESSGIYYSATFPDNASRVKSKAGSSAAWWWLRSASSGDTFTGVGTGGSSTYHGADTTGGVALGFCT